MAEPKFFATSADWRDWLEKHHDQAKELLVGFYKKDSGQPSITWPESVDVALCFGWIDGVRRGIDEVSYSIRFTPRKARSTWSAVNIRRAGELAREGRMHPFGMKAFEARQDDRSGIYAYEQQRIEFNCEQEEQFRANETAWKSFQAMQPSYRRTATFWVVSAKQQQTRNRRLAALIEHSERGETMPQWVRRPKQ